MEMLYGRLSKNEVSSKASRVNQVFCQGHVEKGNELTTAITKYVGLLSDELVLIERSAQLPPPVTDRGTYKHTNLNQQHF